MRVGAGKEENLRGAELRTFRDLHDEANSVSRNTVLNSLLARSPATGNASDSAIISACAGGDPRRAPCYEIGPGAGNMLQLAEGLLFPLDSACPAGFPLGRFLFPPPRTRLIRSCD